MKSRNVVFKKPNDEPKVIETDFSFKALQNLIGGNIKSMPLDSQLDVIFNENAIDQKCELNIAFNGNIIAGNVIIIATDGFMWRGLSNKETKNIIKFLKKQQI